MGHLEPNMPDDVKSRLESYSLIQRKKLLEMRALIFAASAELKPQITLVETLKWTQLAFLPAKPRTGTTIRLDVVEGNLIAFFHCQTTLVDTFRQLYPQEFCFEGNRALIVPINQPIPTEALKHCFGLALTYHSAQRRKML